MILHIIKPEIGILFYRLTIRVNVSTVSVRLPQVAETKQNFSISHDLSREISNEFFNKNNFQKSYCRKLLISVRINFNEVNKN